MAQTRTILGSTVDAEAFQLFRLLGFDSLTEALGMEGEERDQVHYMAGLAMGRELVRRLGLPKGSLDRLMHAFGHFYRQHGLGWVSQAIALLTPVLRVMARPVILNNLRRVAADPGAAAEIRGRPSGFTDA